MSDITKSGAVSDALDGLQAAGGAVRQTADQVKQAGIGAMDSARAVAGEVKERAGALAGSLTEQATHLAEQQKDSLAERLEGMAEAVHRSGEQMQGQQEWLAGLIGRGADELGTLAGALRGNDVQGLIGELGSFAKRQPALFVGASMVAGFALARVGRVAVATAPAAAETKS